MLVCPGSESFLMQKNFCHRLLLLMLFAAPIHAQTAVDLQGHPVQLLAHADTRLVVLFFVASDCPISNRYIPEMQRIHNEFSAQHVAFWWVFPNPSDTPAIVSAHQREYSIEGETILDTAQSLVHLAHATATPEAALFRVDHQQLIPLYRGRIDDRYLAFGKERPHPAHHDLEDAITTALNGRPIAHAVTPPVGCSIVPVTSVQ
jgi:hypothetical protein